MMQLRRFTEPGLKAYKQALAEIRAERADSLPARLLESPDHTETVSSIAILPKAYATRLDLAEAVCAVLDEAGLTTESMADLGLWGWLSAAHFDSVCPTAADGSRNPGADYRYVPTTNFRHFYRHLVRGPVRIYRLYERELSVARILLCQHPSTPGDFVEQLAARQERVTNPAVLGAATKLYFDEATMLPKRGAAATNRRPGTLRRFIDVLDQLDLTYDLYGMTTDQLLTLLPAEFNRFR